MQTFSPGFVLPGLIIIMAVKVASTSFDLTCHAMVNRPPSSASTADASTYLHCIASTVETVDLDRSLDANGLWWMGRLGGIRYRAAWHLAWRLALRGRTNECW